jgi:hypothetical protein
MQLSKLDILDETVDFYSNNTRAVVTVGENKRTECRYVTPEGNKCAVGRCLMDAEGVAELHNTTSAAGLDEKLGLDKILKEEYRGHSVKFWADLQLLHDSSEYWAKGSLSFAGRREYENMTKNISNDRY